MTTLLLSLGTPMLQAGDEFGRTQQGNNNAYCQDNEISWLDWTLADSEEGRRMTAFVGRLTGLRREYATARSVRYLHGQESPLEGVADIDWFSMTGETLEQQDWDNPIEKTLIMRRALRREDGRVEVLLLLLNAAEFPLEFTLPQPALSWRLVLDSADPEAEARDLTENGLTVADRAAAVVAAIVEETPP
jgi:glycogen operon protein